MDDPTRGGCRRFSLHRVADLFGCSPEDVSRQVAEQGLDGGLDRAATTGPGPFVPGDGSDWPDALSLDAAVGVGLSIDTPQGRRFRQRVAAVLSESAAAGAPRAFQQAPDRSLRTERRRMQRLAGGDGRSAGEGGRPAAAPAAALIAAYRRTWQLLRDCDEGFPQETVQKTAAHGCVGLPEAEWLVDLFQRELARREDLSELFGRSQGDALAALLGSLDQTAFGEPVYPTCEERAAHLLYFTVKNHPFVDGNKRIGSLFFLYYLAREGVRHEIGPRELAALTLLVAQSRPADKGLMIRLVLSVLDEPPA